MINIWPIVINTKTNIKKQSQVQEWITARTMVVIGKQGTIISKAKGQTPDERIWSKTDDILGRTIESRNGHRNINC